MSLEELLDKLGLTKYESNAYYYIIKNGSAEAGEITRDANIPNGKIYETLNKLESYGFIEIQHSRPKKYQSRNINIAIEEYLERKKQLLETEFKELESLGTKVIKEYEQIQLDDTPKKEEIFWRTAFGSEIHDLYYNTIKEAKHSILYFLPHSIHDKLLEGEAVRKHRHQNKADRSQEKEFMTKLFNQAGKDKSIKVLFAGQQECPFFKELFKVGIEEKTDIEVRAIQQAIITPPILLIDNIITIMDIVDPLDNHSTIGITKIWDRRLNENLKEKIDMLWRKSKAYKKIFPE